MYIDRYVIDRYVYRCVYIYIYIHAYSEVCVVGAIILGVGLVVVPSIGC